MARQAWAAQVLPQADRLPSAPCKQMSSPPTFGLDAGAPPGVPSLPIHRLQHVLPAAGGAAALLPSRAAARVRHAVWRRCESCSASVASRQVNQQVPKAAVRRSHLTPGRNHSSQSCGTISFEIYRLKKHDQSPDSRQKPLVPVVWRQVAPGGPRRPELRVGVKVDGNAAKGEGLREEGKGEQQAVELLSMFARTSCNAVQGEGLTGEEGGAYVCLWMATQDAYMRCCKTVQHTLLPERLLQVHASWHSHLPCAASAAGCW